MGGNRHMGRPCTICTHTDRVAIEDALEAGQPLRDIAAAYGASKTALHRHWHVHLAERPLPAVGKPHGRSGTRVPALMTWGLWAAGITGLVWLVARSGQANLGEM